MQKPNDTLGDFHQFMGQIEKTCKRLGLDFGEYTSPFELFQDVMARESVETLQYLDARMVDDYLHDDILGDMHRAVRNRLRELGYFLTEGVRTA
ncbi:hypothetical protein [Brevibacillus borstelensis]|uniref:hypothetical protein n=1 Tax=Brevibacillus borstelensis TaxID=45462 RepID=UPI000468EBF4|nr:hypothetical protein [Brevibacillus borstelensis]